MYAFPRSCVQCGERGQYETNSVARPTQQDYSNKLDGFDDFVKLLRRAVRLRRLPLPEWRELQLWPKASGRFGVRSPRSCLRRQPQTAEALKGWSRPIIEFTKRAVSGVMLAAGHPSVALFNELTFSAYAKPEQA